MSGNALVPLQTKLEHANGIDMVAPFGNSLHVSGRDAAALDLVEKCGTTPRKYRNGLALAIPATDQADSSGQARCASAASLLSTIRRQ